MDSEKSTETEGMESECEDDSTSTGESTSAVLPTAAAVHSQMDVRIGRAVDSCQRGDLSLLVVALESGVSPNACDGDGCSLLHWAAINNRVSLVKELISRGADPNICGGVLASSPLHWSARVGHLGASAILVKAGAVCNTRDTQGYTPMHLAVQGQHQMLVAYFLEKFSYATDITDNSGMTPTMWAAFRAFTLFPMRILIQKGADLNATEHLQGNTALHLAVQERNYTAVRELIRGSADVTIRNKQHEMPIDIAKNNRNHRIIGLLEEAALQDSQARTACISRAMKSRLKKYVEFTLPSAMFFGAWILFHTLHYGIAAAVLLAVLLVTMCIYKIDMHGQARSLVPIGVTVAEACTMTVVWISTAHWYAPWWVQLVFLFTMLMLFYSLIRVSLGNPGVIPSSTPEDSGYVEMVEGNLRPQVIFCFTCWVERPQGAKHCSVCDRCVREFDHHCPWLHQCVTKNNLREFVIFVFCVGFSAAIFLVAMGTMLLKTTREQGFNYVLEKYCFVLLIMALSAFHALALSMLFFNQCFQISERVTTHDRIQAHRRGDTRGHGHLHEDVTCGQRVKNILEFCAGQTN